MKTVGMLQLGSNPPQFAIPINHAVSMDPSDGLGIFVETGSKHPLLPLSLYHITSVLGQVFQLRN